MDMEERMYKNFVKYCKEVESDKLSKDAKKRLFKFLSEYFEYDVTEFIKRLDNEIE